MSWTSAGSCPKCGAPMYVPSVWMGVTPPPVTRSCECFSSGQQITTTNTSTIVDWNAVYQYS